MARHRKPGRMAPATSVDTAPGISCHSIPTHGNQTAVDCHSARRSNAAGSRWKNPGPLRSRIHANPGGSDWHAQPKIRGQALGIVYRTIATHLTRKADYTKTTAQTGSVNLACLYAVFAPNSKHRALVTRLQNGARVANRKEQMSWLFQQHLLTGLFSLPFGTELLHYHCMQKSCRTGTKYEYQISAMSCSPASLGCTPSYVCNPLSNPVF